MYIYERPAYDPVVMQMDMEQGQQETQESNEKQVTTNFGDEEANDTIHLEVDSFDETYLTGEVVDSDIKKYFGRPVKIDEFDWLVASNGGHMTYLCDVWKKFLEKVPLNEKLNHFALLRANLVVDVMLNGSPFRYGRMMACYNPWNGEDDVTRYDGVYDINKAVHLSQKPRVFLNPTTGAGGTIVCPFFHPNNYMSVVDLTTEAPSMGELIFTSLAPLKDSESTASEVPITIWAWLDDVSLSTPTSQQNGYITQPEMQMSMDGEGKTGKKKKKEKKKNHSNVKFAEPPMKKANDEWSQNNGVLSKPASWVAKVAGKLEDVPVIGKYAKATSMASGAISNIAALFGYSRINNLDKIQRVLQLTQGEQAVTDASVPTQKLSLDSKQEVTIDPRTVGLDPDDQMGIVDFASRESYVTSCEWASTAVRDTCIFSLDVGPQFAVDETNDLVYHTPLSYIAQMFKYWRGTMKFRFQICGNAFHRGRIALVYDPVMFGAGVQYQNQFVRIIDIAENPDVEIEIGWGQPEPFLNTVNFAGETIPVEPFRAGVGSRDVSSTWNGKLGIYVINPLQGQVTGGDQVTINIFSSCCDDLLLNVPKPIGGGKSYIDGRTTTRRNGFFRGYYYEYVNNDYTRSLPGEAEDKVALLYTDPDDDSTQVTRAQLAALTRGNLDWWWAGTDGDLNDYFFPCMGRDEHNNAWGQFSFKNVTGQVVNTTILTLDLTDDDWKPTAGEAVQYDFWTVDQEDENLSLTTAAATPFQWEDSWDITWPTNMGSDSNLIKGNITLDVSNVLYMHPEKFVWYNSPDQLSHPKGVCNPKDVIYYDELVVTTNTPQMFFPYESEPDSIEMQMDMGAISEARAQDCSIGAKQLEPINPSSNHFELNSVFFGEQMASLRQLFARYCRYSSDWLSTTYGNQVIAEYNVGTLNPHFPMNPGLNSNGNSISSNMHVVQKAAMTPLNWLTPCYAGYRGAIRHKYVTTANGTNMHGFVVDVCRGDVSFGDLKVNEVTSYLPSRNWQGVPNLSACSDTWQGAQFNVSSIGNVTDVELPWYENVRFKSARTLDQQEDLHTMYFDATSSPARSKIDHWVSAGVDFSLFFFTGVPAVHWSTMDDL
ncbi:predicted structural polyprotein [Delisea pulchra RNA virus]|uniref:predicted structural polyprotein n=1 Tax=Delisea pulchra RNA virus TaxID=1781241 RepID=UPI000769D570|nr:predicted structural polyprotein [Delisea pulchra RNA virus]AMB17482.1 predicted structural polyprotein [Delisea pulchra RNA virus]